MAITEQIETFRRLASTNKQILQRLEGGSMDLESLFQARSGLLEALSSQPLNVPTGENASELIQTLAQAQADAARSETRIAEELAKFVSSNEKLSVYNQVKALPKPGKRWDTIG
jgi:hypothetical protein